jgi:hypothetical protein
MGKKTACVLLMIFAVLAQIARAQDTPGDGPANQGPAVQEPADQGSGEQGRAAEGEAPQEERDGDFQESRNSPEYLRKSLPAWKDPFIAGVLSWFMMGIGQIYCREYTKGSLFIAADLADKASLIFLVSHINNKYSPESGTAIINWGSFNDGTKILIIAYLAASVSLRFYSVIDAIQSANKYNERVFSRRERGGLSFSYERKRVSLFYSIPLHE